MIPVDKSEVDFKKFCNATWGRVKKREVSSAIRKTGMTCNIDDTENMDNSSPGISPLAKIASNSLHFGAFNSSRISPTEDAQIRYGGDTTYMVAHYHASAVEGEHTVSPRLPRLPPAQRQHLIWRKPLRCHR